MMDLKTYRFPGDDFIFYGRDEVDSLLTSLEVRLKNLSWAIDEQYKINIALCKQLDELKAKKAKAPK